MPCGFIGVKYATASLSNALPRERTINRSYYMRERDNESSSMTKYNLKPDIKPMLRMDLRHLYIANEPGEWRKMVKHQREVMKLSQFDLAVMCQTTDSIISRWEVGHSTPPFYSRIGVLAILQAHKDGVITGGLVQDGGKGTT